MIARLRGRILQRDPNAVVLDVQGVGYEVRIPLSTYYELRDEGEADLHVHTHVREEEITLYGFGTLLEKAIFRRLIGVSGIGPRTAISLLSGLAPEDLAEAIRSGDLARLGTVPGVGRKTAERLILELRDKMDSLLAVAAEDRPRKGGGATPRGGMKADLLSALENLGYKTQGVEKAVERVLKARPDAPLEELLRETLRSLS